MSGGGDVWVKRFKIQFNNGPFNNFHITVSGSPNPPNIDATAQAFNQCPKECPMYRSGRGCIATHCIKRRISMEEPAKIGEQPQRMNKKKTLKEEIKEAIRHRETLEALAEYDRKCD